MDYDAIEGKYNNPNVLEEGIDTLQIEHFFCRPLSIPMYALDEDNCYFHTFIPETKN
jgi:hypothetical protein